MPVIVKPVTLKEVAARAGVSRAAVSRCFTDGASVSAKMRRKVETAAQELGYSPNVLASSLTTGRTKMIGLISNNFHNPTFLQVFDLFTRGLQDLGLRPLLVNLSGNPDPAETVQMLNRYSVDGVVVASSTLPPSFPQAFRAAGIPVVHAFGRTTAGADLHMVGIDNHDAGRLAAQALILRGYRNIGFLGGPESASSTQDRLQGFAAEVARHPGLRMSASFAGAYSFDAGRAEMLRLLSAAPPAEAYFCGDDVLTIGALAAVQETGRRVPEEIGLIGLNDMEMARWQNINLTTVRQPIPEIVAASVQVIAALLADPTLPPQTRIFPCSVVERGTLRPVLAVLDPI